MSTFNGRIKEYPALVIDNFIPNSFAKYFVLSHVHKDHTKGLEDARFKEKLYCSEQTASLLPLLETRYSKELMYSHLKDCVIPVPFGEPISIETEEHGILKLTFLPANHCVGSSLILIEGDNGTVLYTGDTRAEPVFVNLHLGCLKNYRIKNLYMDTTCCNERRRNFISKASSCQLLVDLIRSYPKEYHIYLDCWTVGYEEMWVAVRDVFQEKIHVSQQRYDMFCSVYLGFEQVLTTDANSIRFHSCRWDDECSKHEEYMVSIHPTPNENNKPEVFIRSNEKRLLQSDLPTHCKPKIQMILPFSTHSSLMEIVFFFKFVRPREFTPCVARGGYEALSNMKELLRREGCRLDTTSSSSEIERANETSSSSLSDNTSPLSLIREIYSNQSSIRSSINYASTLGSSAVGSKTLSWPYSCSVNDNDNNVNRQLFPSRRRSSSSVGRVTRTISKNASVHNNPSSHSHSTNIANQRSSSLMHAEINITSTRQSPSSLSKLIHKQIPSSSSFLDNIPSSLNDANVIVLSITDSVCSIPQEEQFSISQPVNNSLKGKENVVQPTLEKDGCCYGHELAITAETTHRFLKTIKKIQKRKQKDKCRLGTKN